MIAFCAPPPIGPTVPSRFMVPVTATRCPPVSSPGVSTSSTARVKASPAEGPPTVPESMVTSIGKSAPTMRSSGAMPMMARSGSSAAATVVTSTSMWRVAAGGPLDGERVGGAGAAGLQERADLVGLVDRLAVDGDDHVVDLEHLRRRRALDDAPHDRAGGADVDVLAEALERHGDGDELRGVHQLRVVAAVLRLGPAAADRLLREHVDVIVEPAGQRLEQRRRADARPSCTRSTPPAGSSARPPRAPAR